MTKILYVEDEPFLGKIVKESLESRSFDVRLVTDGQLVINAFDKFQPDICVLDVMLPNRDGFSLGKEIREKDSAMPIIFLTAKNQTADVIKGFTVGGNDYVRKPFSVEELIVRINNLLQLSKGQPASAQPTQGIQLGAYVFFQKKAVADKGNERAKTISQRGTIAQPACKSNQYGCGAKRYSQ